MTVAISILSPVHNEIENLAELIERVTAAMDRHFPGAWEYVLVDDCSTDGSGCWLDDVAAKDARIRPVHHAQNMRERAAWKTGFDYASGEVIAMLASDLQSPPESLPEMIFSVLEKGHDVCTGRRLNRKDAKFYSFTTFALTLLCRMLFDVKVRDVSSSFFAVRADLARQLDIVENDHRYILAVFRRRGADIHEIDTPHFPRRRGQSHYKWTKFIWALGEILRFTNRWFSGYYDFPKAITKSGRNPRE